MNFNSETSITTFRNIPVMKRPVSVLKYTDIVSYIAFVFIVPFQIVHIGLLVPLVGFNLILSYFNFDSASTVMEAIIRRIAIFILSMCKIVGYGISIFLVGVYYALVVHDKNIAIFKAMNPVSLDVVDFSKCDNEERFCSRLDTKYIYV